jgi:hypothetical protein
MGLSDLTAPAVKQAIQEFDQLKRKAFLKDYGFGQARDYLIVKDARTYDSKAIGPRREDTRGGRSGRSDQSRPRGRSRRGGGMVNPHGRLCGQAQPSQTRGILPLPQPARPPTAQ